MDPFIGSGTTAVACIKLNRHYTGFEINREYVDVANERIEKILVTPISKFKKNKRIDYDANEVRPRKNNQTELREFL